MKTGPEGIALIKKFEGLRLKAYPDPGTGGEPWTIGYGTTSRAGVGKISKGMVISEAQAESMLIRSLDAYEKGVMNALKNPVTQHQFDAFVSLAYNIGVQRFSTSSVARFFNSGDVRKASDAFLLWRKGPPNVRAGLLRRRMAERDLFLKPDAVASAPPAGKSTAR